MKKFDRITAIFILLQSRKLIKAQEIADRFEVTLRTVYRDIRTLQNAGVPIIGEAGVGYSLIEGYRLPPVQFTPEEATAFLLAEKFVEQHADPSSQKHFDAAMVKLKAVLRNSEKESLESLSPHIEVSATPSAFASKIPKQYLPRILDAVKKQHVLDLDYKKEFSEVATKRQVEPIGIYFMVDNWHLVAYCRLRKDYRDFRVDRITRLHPTEINFDKPTLTLQAYLDQWSNDQNLTKVMISFTKVAASFAQTQKYYYGLVEQVVKGDRVLMTFLSPHLKGIARWLLIFGDQVDVIAPAELNSEIQTLVKALKQHYL